MTFMIFSSKKAKRQRIPKDNFKDNNNQLNKIVSSRVKAINNVTQKKEKNARNYRYPHRFSGHVVVYKPYIPLYQAVK